MLRRIAILIAAALAMSAASGRAQAPTLRFDAAAVHENRSGDTAVQFDIQPGGRFSTTNAPLSDIVKIGLALGVGSVPLEGLPAWAAATRYDITAKADGEPTRDEILRMLRTLLVERFGLVFHAEARDTAVYLLVPSRPDRTPGPRLRRAVVNCAELMAATQKGAPLPPSNRILCGRTLRDGTMMGGGLSMQAIADSLERYAERRVLDRTGLEGDWDFDLTFAELLPADAPARADTPTLVTALPEQLGLKLEPSRAPIQVTVIDRLERPATD